MIVNMLREIESFFLGVCGIWMFFLIFAPSRNIASALGPRSVEVISAFNSRHSVRTRWRILPSDDVIIGNSSNLSELTLAPLVTHLEVNQTIENHACGQGNTVLIDQSRWIGGYQDHVTWDLDSSLALVVCLRVKVTEEWQDWKQIKLEPAYRAPPLLINEPEEVNYEGSSYKAETTADGTPDPTWNWVVNGQMFNADKRSSKLYRQMWHIKYPRDNKKYLEIEDLTYAKNYDHLDVYYEAYNKHGKVRSRMVTVVRPHISPSDCHNHGTTALVIDSPSGAVLSCDSSYDVSVPEMRHTWSYCGTGSCDDIESGNCTEIEEEKESQIFASHGKKLVISHVKQADRGCYKCTSRNVPVGTTCLSTVHLQVNSSDNEPIRTPTILHKYPTDNVIELLYGSHLHLECIHQTYPYMETVWFHNHSLEALKTDARHKLTNGGSVLEIKDLIYSDEGSYRCEVKQRRKPLGDGEFKVHVNVPVHIKSFESKDVFIGDNASLFCDVTFSRYIQWYKDVDLLILDKPGKYVISSDQKTLSILGLNMSDTGTYMCNATARYGHDAAHASLVVLDRPKISHMVVLETSDDRQTHRIYCGADTDPNVSLNITWILDQETCNQGDEVIVETGSPELATLKVADVNDQWKCAIECVVRSLDKEDCSALLIGFRTKDKIACREHGITSETILFPDEPVTPPTNTIRFEEVKADGNSVTARVGNVYLVVGAVVMGSIVLILVVSCVVVKKKRKAKRSTCQSPLPLVQYRSNPLPGFSRLAVNSQYVACSLTDNIKNSLKEVDIPRKQLTMGEMIGKGQFGRVYKGYYENKTCTGTGKRMVAVKTLKYRADERDMVDMFLREALMMKGFDHPHVLSLIGITFDTDSSPLVVLPYMANGDLRTYISNPDMVFRVHELLRLGAQVANGMAYLSELKFVHRDLAARNCMVGERGLVQVADFGLSRDIYQQEYYRTEDSKNPLPIRWMAVESLKEQVFTTKSDVWSFGVLLWELVTRGATPYPGVENFSLSRHIQLGGRMKQPIYCPGVVYDVMVECWHESPKLRPSFEVLQAKLDDILNNPVTSDPETTAPRPQRRCTLEMGINTTRVTRIRTDSGIDELSILKEAPSLEKL